MVTQNGTLPEYVVGDKTDPVWANQVSAIVEQITDQGSAGQVLQKTVTGAGAGTFGWGPPPTAVIADYQPPYIGTFGANGVTTDYGPIVHNLGTTTPHVTWWEPAGSGQYKQLHGVSVTSSADGNSITASFSAQAPATGTIVNISIGGGADGPTFNLLPEVASFAALTALTGNEIGDMRFTANDNQLHVWTGSEWESRGVPFPTPYPLYTITGYTATLPTGETAAANYANVAAFEAAVVPVHSGQRCQIAGYPTAGAYNVLEARWNGTTFEWGIA